MTTRIALLRGINMLGKNMLPMKLLAAELQSIGLKNVRTYIQSGNVIFQSRRTDVARLARDIAACVETHHGFRPHVLLLTTNELQAVAAANPFPQADAAPRSLHVFFLDAPATAPGTAPDARLDAMAAIKSPTEQFQLINRALYLYTPDGFGRSKLAAKAERLLGVPATARNWNTVIQLRAMTQ